MTQLSQPFYQSKPHFSLPSLIAIGCGIASFFAHAGAALVLAIVAIVAGLIGVLVSFSPSVRGGLISILAIVIGVMGFVLGIIKLII